MTVTADFYTVEIEYRAKYGGRGAGDAINVFSGCL